MKSRAGGMMISLYGNLNPKLKHEIHIETHQPKLNNVLRH